MKKSYGFIPDVIKPEDYVFGSGELGGEVLNETGQWDTYLPAKEYQKKNGLETQNCVAFGTLNCIETIMNVKFGLEVNYSDRFLGIVAGTTIQGNSPHKVAETVRKQPSIIADYILPFSKEINTWQKYYSPNPPFNDFIQLANQWRKAFEFKHDWVFGKQPDTIMEALKFSPLGVSVYAWAKKGNYYVNDGQAPNHWCTLYGYETNKYWKVFDHYDNEYKKLAWDYDFEFIKRYNIERKENVQSNWLLDLAKEFKYLIQDIIHR